MKIKILFLLVLLVVVTKPGWTQAVASDPGSCFQKEIDFQNVTIPYEKMLHDKTVVHPTVIHLPLNHELNLTIYGALTQKGSPSNLSEEFVSFEFKGMENLTQEDLSASVSLDDAAEDFHSDVSSILTAVSRKSYSTIDEYNNNGYDAGLGLSIYETHWYPKQEGVVVLVFEATHLHSVSLWATPKTLTTIVRQVIRVTPPCK